ncbi:hypothetical protein BV25DRAFT_1921855 [Artomyces pyxidatus]|uniref:Uncharacterized protein n=1 Tax=Artomyces pyxidatus TaxID=48021 RepID=A0ACB8SG90_9AGAM|nr:hypothetical protein BV25DRAFT_1921855 [Artomyces pyxidatus]
MDSAAFAHSIFGGLPGFNPLMFVNTSGLCATTKLLQCRNFGVFQVDISRKFQRGPEAAPDLTEEDFYARKDVVDQVGKYTDENIPEGHPLEWVPILYQFEVARSAAKRDRDWGHIVFTDLTTTRFLLVMCFGPSQCDCGNPYHHDYEELTKYQADRFMSLATYVYHKGNKLNWVRATYTTTDSKVLPVSFMDPNNVPTGSEPGKPSIFHITADDFVPSLLPAELEKIDNLLAQSSRELPPPALRQKVLGTKEARPKPEAWMGGKEKVLRQCAYCEKLGDQKMPMCSRCKLVRYCDATCQKAAWKAHKPVCKVAANVTKA